MVTAPAPGIPEPEGWQDVQPRLVLSTICCGQANQQIVRSSFGILDVDIEKTGLEYAGMPKLKFRFEF